MKKVIFGIFAHPDDEAFGPSGTLLAEAKNGSDVYLITLTLGDAGMNPDNAPDLAAVRENEWRSAGKLIGATEQIYLGYKDGQLNNLVMIEAAAKLETLVRDRLASYDETTEVEFITMDLNGITGHIDHIVAARAACLAFYRQKASDQRFRRIRLACVPAAIQPTASTAWLFMEAGRNESDIDEVVNSRQYREEILAIMRCHHSQRGDGEAAIASRGDTLGVDYFVVKT